MPPHWQRGRDAPSDNAQQKTKAQTHGCAITGAVSLWLLSLVRTRESNPAVRPGTDLTSSIASAIQIKMSI